MRTNQPAQRFVNRRDFLRWSMITGAGLVTVACAASPETAPAADSGDASSEIAAAQLLTWSIGYGEEAYQRTVVEKFNESHPDIQLSYDPALAGLEFLTEGMQKFRIALDNQSGPDIIGGVDTGAALEAVVSSGQIMDLTNAYAEYGWDQQIPQNLIDAVTIDGKIYSIPQSIETVGLFYNVDLFNELDLVPPETYDDFLQIMETLKEAGYYGYAMGLAGGWPSAFMASDFMYVSAGSKYASVLAGEIPWTECEECLAGLTAFHDIVESGYTNPDVLGIDQDQANDLFFQGQTATTLQTNGWIGSVRLAEPDFDVGFFYLPPINPETDIKSLGGVGGSLVIANYTEHPEAALEFANWLLSPEQLSNVFVETGNIAPIDFPIPEEASELARQIAEATLANSNAVGFWPVTYLAPQVFSEMNAFIQGMMGGQLTPEEVLVEMQNAHQSYLQESGG